MDDLPLPAVRALFDQQPIGNANKLMLDEYPPDFDPSKIQAKPEPLPIAKRILSKVFKVKKQAMEELLKILTNQNHQIFCEHQTVIINSIADSNPQCQILAAKILFHYLDKSTSYEGQVKLIVKNVIQKLLVIERQQAQHLGMEILFWLMDHQHQETLMPDLNDYLVNKNPKIVGVSFKVIHLLLHNYGPKRLGDLQIFCKNLKLLAAAKPLAKPQMIQFFKQAFKWTGENTFNLFNMHTDCKEEVVKWSKAYEKQPMEIKRGLKKGEEGKKVDPTQQDEQDNIPVDVLPHFDSRWVDTVLALEKWQQKKQHLEDFIKKTNTKTIVPRETSHYITLLKRLFQDNNINLLQCGFKIVKNLCRGLKKAFSVSCKSILSYIYLRLKDNKALIVDETLATLKAMTASVTIEDLEREVVEGVRDKSPQMRLNTLKLLKELSAKKEPKTTRILKSILNSLVSLTNDSSSEVRDAALAVLCKIKENHGMIFFQDKLESLPAKKVNTIRSTPTNGKNQNDNAMEIQQTTQIKSNSSMAQPPKNNLQANKQIKNQPPKKKIEPVTTNKNQLRQPEKSFEKKPIHSIDTNQKNYQMQTASISLSTVLEESHSYRNNSASLAEKQEREMMEIRQEQWPIVPKNEHVHRLVFLFTKLGEPFASLATPFRLTTVHVQTLQNFETNFIIDNADLLLKWALWRIQTENPEIIEKITSVVIHLIFLLKTKMNDSLTVLIMSILSNLLESDFNKMDMLRCINTSIMEISQPLREKVFNFWLTTLNEYSSNPAFCDKMLHLIQTTHTNIGFTSEEFVAMARVQPIVRSKSFMAFLQTKKSREFLKVTGFKLIDNLSEGNQWLVRRSESDFAINILVEQRIYFFDIFKKMSHEATEDLINIEKSCGDDQIISTHIKIMDSVMLPYLDQCLQSINMHNYMSRLAATLNRIKECYVTPYLRNLLRLLMFFLVDVNSSNLEDKQQITKSTNKVILIILDKVPADHLLEVMQMLLKYSLTQNLARTVSNLLTKCMKKTSLSQSFSNKAQKNVRNMFNFMISFIEEFKIDDSDTILKSFTEMFTIMMNKYKELCFDIVCEKLNQFNGSFMSQAVFDLFSRFINNPMNNPEQNNESRSENGMKQNRSNVMNQAENSVMENNSFMSNLPQKYAVNNNSMDQNQQCFNAVQSNTIRQATNIPRKDDCIKLDIKLESTKNPDLLGNEGVPKIKQERRRVQNYTGFCQTYIELTRMQDQLSTGPTTNTVANQSATNQNEHNQALPAITNETEPTI